MKDVRLVEFQLLQMIAAGGLAGSQSYYSQGAEPIRKILEGIDSAEVFSYLLESLYIEVQNDRAVPGLALLIRGDFRGQPPETHDYELVNPRGALLSRLRTACFPVTITWRGRQRIEDLRSQLTKERIFERFGILLDMRYYAQDLEDELARQDRQNISVMALDLDKFKAINDKHGHKAGDEVLKAYLVSVRDVIGTLGMAYRGTGDEVQIILPGIPLGKAIELAEKIRASVAANRVRYQDSPELSVTTSIGVASTPPLVRTPSIEDEADRRQIKAKEAGRDRIVSA